MVVGYDDNGGLEESVVVIGLRLYYVSGGGMEMAVEG